MGIPALRNSSNSGIFLLINPTAAINAPRAPITPANTTAPKMAAGPIAPTIPRIIHAADIPSSSTDNALAVSIDGTTSKSFINLRTFANSAMTPTIAKRATAPSKAFGPISDAMVNAPVIANRSMDNPPAAANVDATGRSATIRRILASKYTTPTMTNIVSDTLPAYFVTYIKAVSIPSIDVIATVATATFFGSKQDNVISTPPRIPMTTAITINVFIRFPACLEYFVIRTSKANMPSIADMHAVPRITFSGLSKLRSAIAPTRIRMASDIFKSIAPALSACFPANSETLMMTINIASIRAMVTKPFVISPIETPASNRIETANIPMAAAIPNNIVPTLLTSPNPKILVTAMKAANRTSTRAITTNPLSIS